MKIQLQLPVKDVYINQPFGVNYVDFYKKLGLDGHNGLDFKAKTGCKLFACNGGIVTYASFDEGGGNTIIISSTLKGDGFKTIYYHLFRINVQKGQTVVAGDLIGLTGNTGKYTTGPHLHLGLKKIKDGATINWGNGYKGAIDPSKYFKKNWNKTHAYHRYYRERNWLAEYKMRFKNAWLHKQQIIRGKNPIMKGEEINALVYGGWDYPSIINPAMYQVWAYMKKDEFTRGRVAFK